MPDTLDLTAYLYAAKRELKSTLLAYADLLPGTLITMGKFALSGQGKLFSLPETDSGDLEGVPASGWPPWIADVLLSCTAALEPVRRDEWALALPGAVAVEIAMAAADLLDELADDDPSSFVGRYGVGQALNTGNLMLVMAQQILQREALGPYSERALAALGALQDMLVQAASGQHLDMLYQSYASDGVTLEMSARMTELKAGALVSGAFRIGALMSGAPTPVVELLAEFGKASGSISQLANDIRDVLPRGSDGVDETGAAPPVPKTDLRRRKRTLPIVFTLRDDAPFPNALQRAYGEHTQGDEVPGEDEMRQAIVDAGAVRFASLIAEVHRQKALEILDELEGLRPGARDLLLPLLPPSSFGL